MSDATPVGRHRVDTRRRWLFILGGVVAVVVIGYALYYFLYAAYFQSTDDAYVGGDIVAITSQENGTVLALHADNTEGVRRGQVLIELEPIKPRVAMEAAIADLARTVRGVRTDFSRVNQARAQLNSAQIAASQAQADYRRRASAGNAVSAEELVHAREAVSSTQAAVAAAQSALAQALSSVQGTSTATNPDVLAAIARLRSAAIVLQHMRLLAPVDGVVAQRTVQVGQQIAPGTPLMAVVPLQSVWVDANFKEGQLADMRIGQPATVTADIYGGSITYHGKVIGLGAGSGSAFALLPPQNASGNWIKIVQRVPVRIALDPKELRDHPLRLGLSVNVSVDISNTSGSMTAAPATYRIKGIAGSDGGADTEALIHRILSENGS